MARPKFFRDPVHGQIRYHPVDLSQALPCPGPSRLGWVIRKLIDCPEFQRLRHIRQNGLTNLVFHGAEHSRFTHSMGVAALAGDMLDRVARNMDETPDEDTRLAVAAAALLHDIGHGPFSHTLEEACKAAGIPLNHEKLTVRIITEESNINRVLREVDQAFPQKVASFIDKSLRKDDHWTYRLVSSQLDADRLDYMKRDARAAGLQGYDFDLARLLDCLEHLDSKRIAVNRRAIAAVELYLVALDKLYSSVYYHHAIRAATVLLGGVLQRAVELFKSGTTDIFKAAGASNPLNSLIVSADKVPVAEYARFGEFHVWSLIEEWQRCGDKTLADLSTRLFGRRLFKTIDFDPAKYNRASELHKKAEHHAQKLLCVREDLVRYYVQVDEPSRTSYKTYDWRSETPDESIWMVGDGKPLPVESEDRAIVSALKGTRHFHRLVVPAEIRNEVMR